MPESKVFLCPNFVSRHYHLSYVITGTLIDDIAKAKEKATRYSEEGLEVSLGKRHSKSNFLSIHEMFQIIKTIEYRIAWHKTFAFLKLHLTNINIFKRCFNRLRCKDCQYSYCQQHVHVSFPFSISFCVFRGSACAGDGVSTLELYFCIFIYPQTTHSTVSSIRKYAYANTLYKHHEHSFNLNIMVLSSALGNSWKSRNSFQLLSSNPLLCLILDLFCLFPCLHF